MVAALLLGFVAGPAWAHALSFVPPQTTERVVCDPEWENVCTAGPGQTSQLYVGTNGADSIAARGGDDHIKGKNGGDDLYGNTCRDFIKGGDGVDMIRGNQSPDTIFGAVALTSSTAMKVPTIWEPLAAGIPSTHTATGGGTALTSVLASTMLMWTETTS
jgi:Ca2+-binding RTX toxin-like protein